MQGKQEENGSSHTAELDLKLTEDIDSTRRRILMEGSRDGIVVIAEEGNVIECNLKFCEMLGYSQEEALNLSVWDWEYRYTPDEVREMLRTVDEKGDHIETKHRRKDGSVFDVDINTNAVVFNSQKIIFCSCRDVTDKKQAEATLRESRELFATIFQSSPVMMAIIDLQTSTYSEVNDSYCQNIGYTRDELIGNTDDDIKLWVNPEDKNRMMSLMENGQLRQQKFKFRVNSGETRTWLCSADIISIQGRDSLLAVATDITEQEQAEEKIRISSAAFKSIHDAVIIMDNEFIVTEWNHVSEELFGIKAVDAIGQFIGNLMEMQEEFPGQNAGRMALLIERGWNREEQRYRTPLGEIWVDVHAQAIEGQNHGDRHGWVTLASDISERKKDEEEIHELYKREKALRESLEQETKKRVEFTRVLVHELKTPLTPIMATSEMLASEMKEEPWSSMARNIFRGGENLSKRIDELLDLARGEIGTLKVEPVLLHPSDYLRQIVTEMVPAAATRNQALVIEIPEDLPHLRADAQRIRQVLTNLINNAFKFTNDDGVITVKAYQNQRELIVEVQDTGSGLTEDEQAKLFHAYERLEADRQKLSGLGLGLALSKNLIELHGGRIWVKSKKGKGSVFGFALPINTNRER